VATQEPIAAPVVETPAPKDPLGFVVAEDGLLVITVNPLATQGPFTLHIVADTDETSGPHTDTLTVASVSKGTVTIRVDTPEGVADPSTYTLDVKVIGPTQLANWGMSPIVAKRALDQFARGWSEQHTKRLLYTVIDYAIPSHRKRLWVMDFGTGTLINHLLVTHGSGSNPGPDPSRPTVFSNVNDSHQSSLGLMKTGETYYGMWGYSLKLDGLDPVLNGRVRDRHIVVHGADWAGQKFLDQNGTLGMSWGCPTVGSAHSRSLIDTIKNETLVYSDFNGAAPSAR